MPHVLSVARELVKLSLSGDEPDPLTNLRLQKLLYYAQAWSLVIRESELFSDELEAWGQGPVVPAAYHALSDGPIRVEAFAGAPVLRDEEAEFVRRLWEAYSPYSALQLSKMVREEAPWLKARENRPKDGGGNNAISVLDLEAYFGGQTMPAPLAAFAHELRKRGEEAERRLAELAPLDVGRLTAAATSFTPSTNVRIGGG